MRHILMIYQKRSSFVKRDIDTLSKNYRVSEFLIPIESKVKILFKLVALTIKLTFSINKYDFVICQGAGFQSFPPALVNVFKKFKVVIIAIGTDCAKIPEINYGNFRKPLLGWVTAYSFRKASLILPVDDSLIKKHISYTDLQFPDQGIVNLVPNIKTPMTAIHNGYKTNEWKVIKPYDQREKSFLSVSANLNNTTFKLKGFDLIFDLARRFPSESFTLVGNYSGSKTVPSNISFLNNMTQSELVAVYNEHKYYLQLSMSEGFPNALCEAMLCGCVPVVSDIGAMPNIVGKEGVILPRRDSDLLNKLINSLLTTTQEFQPSRRISDNFPLENREAALFKALDDEIIG